MGTFFRPCSVCSAPAQVTASVNLELSKRTKLRDIAKLSGISKSAIHRHSQKCLPREVLAAYKTARFNPNVGRVFVQWPEDPSCPSDVRGKLLNARAVVASLDEITENDVVLNVVYEHTFDTEGRYLKPLQAFEPALKENAARDAAKLSPNPEPDITVN